MPGVDPGYSKRGGGGANSNVWRVAVAAGRVPLKLLPCVLDVCNIFVGICMEAEKDNFRAGDPQ